MKKLLFSLALACGVAAAQAHFVFAVIADGALQVGLEDRPGVSHVPAINNKSQLLELIAPGKKKLQGKLGEDGYVRAPLGDLKVAGAQIRYGVLERGEEVYLLEYHAKAAVDADAARQKVGLGVELVLDKDGLGWFVQAIKDGKVLKNLDLVVGYPGKEDEELDVKIDDQGRFDLHFTNTGRLILRTIVKAPVKGELDGKKYEEHRTYSTLVINSIAP